MKAHEIAEQVATIVGVDRAGQHGSKKENFDKIATLWNAYLGIRRHPADPLTALDHAHMMVLLKVARTQSGSTNPDDWMDMAGYAVCAGEVADQNLADWQANDD